MTRHSHEDALSDDEYGRLVGAAGELRSPFDAEASLILACGGRLGMRAGEICHLREDWINWNKQQIRIPRYEDCSCGYCHKQARQAVDYDPELEMDAVLDKRWKPKTANAARAIPFDFDSDVEATIRAFFDRFDRYEHSRVSINRRVNRVAEEAGMDASRVYPHALRATAATYHAYRGLPPVALQSLFGWSQLAVAQKYIRLSGGSTAKALRDVHSD